MNAATPQTEANVTLIAIEHAFKVRGLIAFLRDTADLMHTLVEKCEPICPGEAAGWVMRLDTIGNALAVSNDEMSDTLSAAGFSAPLAWGNLVHREGT